MKVFLFALLGCLSLAAAEPSVLQKKVYNEKGARDFIWLPGFRGSCHHIYDPRAGIMTLVPKNVAPGDIIFVRNAERFFTKVAPLITNPYIVVTHGWAGESFKESFNQYINLPNVIAWFTIHPPKAPHPKLFPLPLGVTSERKLRQKMRAVRTKFAELRKKEKKHLVYLNLSNITPLRNHIIEKYKSEPYCYYVEQRKTLESYFEDLAESKFTLAPPGIGIDSFRAWESLFAGSIPIVLSSQLNELYTDLPVLIVENFDTITPEFLEAEYKKIRSKSYSLDKLYMNYWKDRIMEVRLKFLHNYEPKKAEIS